MCSHVYIHSTNKYWAVIMCRVICQWWVRDIQCNQTINRSEGRGDERYLNSCPAKGKYREFDWERELFPLLGKWRLGGSLQQEGEEHSRETDGRVVHQVHTVHEGEGFARRYGPVGEGLELQDRARKGCVCERESILFSKHYSSTIQPLSTISSSWCMCKYKCTRLWCKRHGIWPDMDLGMEPASISLALGSQKNYLISLGLDFFTCNIGITLTCRLWRLNKLKSQCLD